MPVSLVVITLAAIFGGTLTVIIISRMVLKYLSSKHQAEQRVSSPTSLTTSELHGLIRSAVAEATEPLSSRVADLEQRLEATPLPPAGPVLLEGIDGYVTETMPAADPRQTVR